MSKMDTDSYCIFIDVLAPSKRQKVTVKLMFQNKKFAFSSVNPYGQGFLYSPTDANWIICLSLCNIALYLRWCYWNVIYKQFLLWSKR